MGQFFSCFAPLEKWTAAKLTGAKRAGSVLLLPALLSSVALAEEGMWTFNNFPKERVKRAYQFEPSDAWLDKVRLSSARLANGCSGSFVSSTGLVMTNHHCVNECVEQLSSAGKDLIAKGFYAEKARDEKKCPEIEVNRLLEITDITTVVQQATKGLQGQAFNDAQKASMARMEQECSAGNDKVRCEVVTLYHGGKYNLYKYQRYQDVRLVFAPELAIAFFGGDPDNFNFPRYDLDSAFLRVYENNEPLKNKHFFSWSKQNAKEGDLTFVTGHPGRTSRLLTTVELEFDRDVGLLRSLLKLSELRGFLTEFQKRSAEAKRISAGHLFSVENSLKALKGRHQALLDKKFFSQMVANEQKLRAKVNANPQWKKEFGGAWDEIAKAVAVQRDIFKEYAATERNTYGSKLFEIARTIVRSGDELSKPNEKRLREFGESRLPQLKQELFSDAPIYDEFEVALMAHAFTKLREDLSPDHPFVKKVLGKNAPMDLAKNLVKGTQLKSVKAREALFKGGKDAIAKSSDAMIQLALLVDADSRSNRERFENEVESVVKKNSELVAKAKFATEGTDTYPDATFTLRISYGKIQGFPDSGKMVPPLTTMGGAFARHTGADPFALPPSWLKAEAKINKETPFNFVSTNDIIGGNSGSPVINKNAEIIGLIFDGNIHSLGGAYGFDPTANRAVSVHSAAIVEALRNIYGAQRVVDDLLGANATGEIGRTMTHSEDGSATSKQ